MDANELRLRRAVLYPLSYRCLFPKIPTYRNIFIFKSKGIAFFHFVGYNQFHHNIYQIIFLWQCSVTVPYFL